MSDISAVGSDSTVSTGAIVSEELTEAQAKGLIEEDKTAIQQNDFDRATQINTQLSQVHYKAQAPRGWTDTIRGYFSGSKSFVSESDLFGLFSSFCRKNHDEGKKLIPTLSKNFSIETDGYHYKISASGFSGSFTIPIKTDSEAKALIDHIYKLKSERKFEDLEGELPRLAMLCADRKVAMDDFTKLYINLVFANVTFAVKCIPIFKDVFLMKVVGDRLFTRDMKSSSTSNFTSGALLQLDCDSNLKRIATIENPIERFNEYLLLARHQLDRVPEVMRKAEDELNKIEGTKNRFSAGLLIAVYYQRNHDEKNCIRMASTLERELAQGEAFEEEYYLFAKLNIFKALAYLEKRDQIGFDRCISVVTEEMSSITDAKLLERVQKDLKFLKSEREQSFTIDQIELHARKI